MSDFDTLSDEQKLHYHQKILSCADAVGGMNFFLQLLEAIRSAKVHPLYEKTCLFQAPTADVKWNKSIFKDKVLLLMQSKANEVKYNNLIPPKKESKTHKNVIHLVRALSPIVFEVKPKNDKDAEGFSFSPFEIIDQKTTKLNPIFDAVFLSSIDSVRKVLNYKKEDR